MTAKDERADFYERARAFTSIVLAEADGARFLVQTGDETVGRSLFVRGSRGERGTLARTIEILETLGLGDAVQQSTFVDVGANIGTSTVFALLSHPFARAVACEPEPSNYDLLKLNLALNDVDWRVRSLPVAVSDKTGTAELALHTTNSGGHQVVDRAGPSTEGPDAPLGGRIDVERVTLDQLVESGVIDVADVGLVWIDVQGHEGHVLKGAAHLVRRGVPVLLEYYPSLLRQAGDLALLEQIAGRRYTHFIDVRAAGLTPQLFESHPVEALPAYADRFAAGEPHPFTDLLFVRLPR